MSDNYEKHIIMNGKALIVGIATCLGFLGACSDRNDAPVSSADDVISFNAVVPGATRGVPTTTASIKEFTVYAFTGGSMLMDGVKVTRDGGSWTYSPEAYWPVTPVNFYAFSPEIDVPSVFSAEKGGNIPGYVNHGNVDLLYSVRKDVAQQAAPVSLNFRHALSKVSVLMSSANQRINVAVSYISLKNIYLEGTFNFPESSTLSSTPDVVGSWSNLKRRSEMVTFAVIGQEDRVELTPVPTDYTLNTFDLSYVIPQPLNDVELSAGGYSGTFIEVDCEIFDSATGAKLWPNANTPDYMLVPHTETGRIIYPLTSGTVREFLPGHAYVYNIQINNPSVLDKIEFDVTVDDYSIDQM